MLLPIHASEERTFKHISLFILLDWFTCVSPLILSERNKDASEGDVDCNFREPKINILISSLLVWFPRIVGRRN